MLVWVSERPRPRLRVHTSVSEFRAFVVMGKRGSLDAPHPFLHDTAKERRGKKDVQLTVSIADKKCPFTGMVSIRGRILTGTVVSTKMHRTLIIRREYLHFVPKYARYEKRHANLAAHVSPAFRVEEGDQVTVGQCRPLSKTVRFGRTLTIYPLRHVLISVIGSIQRPPCAAPNRQGDQVIPEVLSFSAR